jgi:hypothetical protein
MYNVPGKIQSLIKQLLKNQNHHEVMNPLFLAEQTIVKEA